MIDKDIREANAIVFGRLPRRRNEKTILSRRK